jgi:hypothetical protein
MAIALQQMPAPDTGFRAAQHDQYQLGSVLLNGHNHLERLERSPNDFARPASCIQYLEQAQPEFL